MINFVTAIHLKVAAGTYFETFFIHSGINRSITCGYSNLITKGLFTFTALLIIFIICFVFLFSATKISILMSCVFALQVKGLLNVNLSSLSLIFTVFMASFQLLFLFTDHTDPLAPLEDTLAAIFLRQPDQAVTISSNERKKKSD